MHSHYKIIQKLSFVQKYDLIIINTDDDKNAFNFYNYFFNGCKLFVINISPNQTRSKSVSPHLVFSMFQQGMNSNPDQIEYHLGWNRLTVNEKMTRISERITVVVVGKVSDRCPNFFSNLKSNISNFADIDFVFINRSFSRTIDEPNFTFIQQCNTNEMFDYLDKAHYLYFYPDDLNEIVCTSGMVCLCYATLTPMILPLKKWNIDNFISLDGKSIELERLDVDLVQRLSDERDSKISATEMVLKKQFSL